MYNIITITMKLFTQEKCSHMLERKSYIKVLKDLLVTTLRINVTQNEQIVNVLF